MDANGDTVIFKKYITSKIVAVNGKAVTIIYSSRGVSTTKYLRQVKE